MSDMQELFNRTPHELTDSCLDAIIAEFRNKRHLFQTAPKASRAPTKARSALPSDIAAAATNLEIKL